MRKKAIAEKNEQAVSETIGFIIIFGIMLTGIGLVTLYGYPALIDQQTNANIRNMERNMISVQSDIKSLAYKSVPYKETSFQTSGGTFMVELPSDEKWFKIKNDSGSSLIQTSDGEEFRPGGLTFISEGEDVLISLQNGAIVKHQGNGSVLLSEPRWFKDGKTLVINLIRINSSEYMATTGMVTVQMSIKPYPINSTDGSNIIDYYTPVGGEDIKIQYHDTPHDYYTGWNTFFEHSSLGMVLDSNPPKIWKISNLDRIVIKAWEVDIHGI